MNKILMLAVLAGIASAHGSSTNEWTGAVNDWNWDEAGNYRDGKPTAGDIVRIPAGATVKLNASTDSASLGVVNSLKQIWPVAVDSTLEVTVASDDEKAIAVPFTCYNLGGTDINSYTNGVFVKKGDGLLNLTAFKQASSSFAYDYYSTLKIEAGTLKLPQVCDNEKYVYLGRVDVDANAVFVPYGASSASFAPSTSKCAIYFCEITGAGTITNTKIADEYMLRPRGERESTFDGRIESALAIYSGGGSWNLVGENSDMREYINLQGNKGAGTVPGALGVLGIKYFGNGTTSVPSSLGPTPAISFRGEGGALKYLGTGETTTKTLYAQSGPDVYEHFLDGGVNGGLNWMGDITTSIYQGQMERLVLCGSHANTCTIGGALTAGDQRNAGATGGLFFIKRGSGTWRFAETATGSGGSQARANRTGFVVEGGTLQFDSLAETNQYCSLGRGTRLQRPYSGAYDEANNIDWFFTLGKTNATETLPYLDFTNAQYAVDCYTGGVAVATRTIGLVGDGGVRNTSDHRFRFSGVKAVSSGRKMLYLDGTRDGGDEILDISDGTAGGTVGVVKTGSGTWTIGGDLDFTGPVEVREGTLIVKRYSPRYTWFRYSIRDLYNHSSTFMLMELGVYDADGKVLSQGLKTEQFGWTNVLDYAELEPGYAAYFSPSRANSTFSTPTGTAANRFSDPRDLNKAFDGSLGGNGWNRQWNATIKPAQSETWPVCEFRLPLGSATAASYDFRRPGGASYGDVGRLIVSWTLEGSHDGLHWQELHKVDNDTLPASGAHWASGANTSSTVSPHTTGYAIAGQREKPVAVRPLSVKMGGNATLKADLTEGDGGQVVVAGVSCTPQGAGKFEGVIFANEGVLELTDVDEMAAEVQIGADFGDSNCDALNSWQFKINGAVRNGYEVKADHLGITIKRKPLAIMFK